MNQTRTQLRFDSAMAGPSPAAVELLNALRARSRSVEGRERVGEALYELALDIVGDESDLPPAERRWLSDALSMPVSEAAQEAIDTLLRELAATMASAPPRVRPTLAGRTPVSRIDFE